MGDRELEGDEKEGRKREEKGKKKGRKEKDGKRLRGGIGGELGVE